MEDRIKQIRKAEEEADTRIDEARKANSVRAKEARDKSESAGKEIDKDAESIIDSAREKAEERAKKHGEKMRVKQDKKIVELRAETRDKFDKAAGLIVEEFGKWQ